MREDEIRRLVKIVEESGIGELEYSRWGRKIRISKTPFNSHYIGNSGGAQLYHVPQSSPPPAPSQPALAAETSPAESGQTRPADSTVELKSPMVGTFYRSPSPDTNPYVEKNSIVKKGQPLCIIEAMKLMNEIEAEIAGRIIDILVENGQPVEYNQPLFLIEPA
jgi:acetyl-CoA carboxylase biotin carboxyl carrier protein